MSSAASSELDNYRIQLEQVEAALVAEPENEELIKLKEDLVEIINLQKNLYWAIPPLRDLLKAMVLIGRKNELESCLAKWTEISITFTGNGTKHMVKISELQIAPVEEKKNYIFQSNKGSGGGPKKEWQMERERRKLRAQKKEQRRKTLEETKEQEKNKWHQFNAKASAKSMKGLKRVEASSSAQDGSKASSSSRLASISSRQNHQAFGASQRGNMDSLF
uniref:Uncharacterized protein n=1 Tax=Ditylenchus dipsaci TaxID=166011 RepID=A0A915ERM1_9BILA